MSRLLHLAEKEIQSIKRRNAQIGLKEIKVILDCSRNPEDTERLVGYPAFKEAFDMCRDIPLACERSGLNLNSVIINPLKKVITLNTIHFKI